MCVANLTQNRILNKAASESGFTFLEVIVVLILIGIVSAVLWSKPQSDPTLAARTEAIKAHIRYAQARSMNTERIWGIKSDGSYYWLFADGDPSGSKIILPGENGDVVSLSDHGLSMTPFLLTFDKWGRPCSDLTATLPLADELILVVTAQGQSTRQILVTPDTGFIP